MPTSVEQKIKPLLLDTYVTVVKNSLGSNMFRSVYAEVNDIKVDITKNGDLSCAFYASSILLMFKLIKEIHTTVDGTIKDLENSGWFEIETPKPGCVLVWMEKEFESGELHKHIGFYIGENKAISNSSKNGSPTEHEWDSYDGRPVEMILAHPRIS